MIYLYYKDILSNRQNIPFAKYLQSKNIQFEEISSVNEIKIEDNKKITIFYGTLEFFSVYIKFFFNNKIIKIYRSRGIMPEESYFKKKSTIKKFFLSLIEYIVLKYSDLIVTVSENQKSHYHKKYKISLSKIVVLHNYLTNYYLPVIKSRELEIVYSGGLSKWQNLETIISIFEKISKSNDKIKFLFCVSEENKKKIMPYLKKLNNYTVESYDDYENLIDRISKAAVGIILRDNNIINFCSSPFKIIDYLNAKLPMILTDNIGDYGNLLKNQNFAKLIKYGHDNNIDEILDFVYYSKQNYLELVKEIDFFTSNKMSFSKEFEIIMRRIGL